MQTLTDVIYLISTIFFILGLKYLTATATARRGNLYIFVGLLIAIIMTLLEQQIIDVPHVIAGLIIGAVIGEILVRKHKKTAMLQMVAFFNAFGGAASALVALLQFSRSANAEIHNLIALALALFLGAFTVSGSLVAAIRLRGLGKQRIVCFRGRNFLVVLFLLATIATGGSMIACPELFWGAGLFAGVTLILGVLILFPVNGVDAPVIISLLNSCSGFAAVLLGFALNNTVLIISGALVGAAGIVLTRVLRQGTNQTLWNMLSVKTTAGSADKDFTETRKVTPYTPEDAALILESAQSVIVVPGYGLAAAGAQHGLRKITEKLISQGKSVRYALHPLAGRMPGHINMVLTEANIPENLLIASDKIDVELKNTDVVLVIGANDVINPAIRSDASGGTHMFNLALARSVVIFNRSISPGFAGEANDLFYDESTMIVFGDAKDMLAELALLMTR